VQGIELKEKQFTPDFKEINGFCLKKYVELEGVCKPNFILFIVSEILKVFEHLHKNGYTYSEVKIPNIFISNHRMVLTFSEALIQQIFGQTNV
jgi:serine/threonine protein kinase